MNEIAVRNVSVSYGEKRVLTDFSAVFPAGRCTAIMGPSGCGKTTLLSVIAGLLVPDAGEVVGMPPRFTMVFQEDRLCEDFTVAANLRLVTPRARSAEIPVVLAAVGLSALGAKRVTELSGGMNGVWRSRAHCSVRETCCLWTNRSKDWMRRQGVR